MNKVNRVQKVFFAFMRITLIQLMLAGILSICSYGSELIGQDLLDKKISLTVKDEDAKSILQKIEKKAAIKFTYQAHLVKNSGNFSFSYTNVAISDILKELFRPEVNMEVVGNQVILRYEQPPLLESAATVPIDIDIDAEVIVIRITGTVLDENNEPMPGVNILVKGTNIGTTTDNNGKYAIEVPDENSVLVFTFIGYASQEIAVGSQSVIDMTMIADITSLNEIVIVGYGEQKKSDITGSISVVEEKLLREIPAGNIASALQGMAAGVAIQKDGGNSHPGSTPVIRIRGERSLGGYNNPLIIVDGIPYDGSLNDISPDDIVSVQVLKDASSTAIYGSRGSNGVILINTKRGKDEKASVTYSGYVGVNRPLGKYDMMNAQEFYEFKKWSKYNGMPSGTYTGIDDPQVVTDMFTDLTEYDGYQKGVNTDWQDQIYETSVLTNHQIGLSGGSGKTNYAASLGYYNSTGIYEKQGMERYSVKLSIDQEIGKYVKIGISSLNSYNILTGMDVNPMEQALQASPFLSPYNEDGTLKGFLGSSQNVYNPLKDFEEGAVLDDKVRFTTFNTAYLDIDFTHGFKYKLNAGIQLNPETAQKYYAKETTKQVGRRNWGFNESTKGYNYTLENILTYDKTVAEDHHFNVTGVYSIQERETQRFSTEYNDVISDFIGYYNPSLASNHTANGGFEKWTLLSYMGRLNYSFLDKYLLTFTVRSDGSSRLAEGNKWHTFPTGAIGWNIGRESFLGDAKFISALKLRASYGTVGSTAVDAYKTKGLLSGTRYNFGSANVLGYYPATASNYDLTWEKTTTLNVGLDYGFFNDRITGVIEYYIQNTSDLLMNQKLPATSGIPNEMKVNVGETQNKGMEFTVKTVNLDGDGVGQLRWSTDVNIFFNRQEIKRLASGAKEDKNNRLFLGYPNNVYYDYKRVGIWQNTPEDIETAKAYGLTTTGSGSVIGAIRVEDHDNDGDIDDMDRMILGYRQPDFEGGITNTLYYKNFDFSLVAYFKVGGMMQSDMHNGWMNTFQAGYNNLDVNYWTPDNHENYWPKPNASQQNPQYKSTLTYMDASYLKIRTITLGYKLPQSALSRVRVQSARLYTTVSNPFTFFSEYVDDFGGLDPETNGNVSLNTPAMWSMLLGLNVTF